MVGFMQGNEIVEPMSWTAHEQDLVAHLDVEARKAWYKKGHPGWAFYPSKPVKVFEVGAYLLSYRLLCFR